MAARTTLSSPLGAITKAGKNLKNFEEKLVNQVKGGFLKGLGPKKQITNWDQSESAKYYRLAENGEIKELNDKLAGPDGEQTYWMIIEQIIETGSVVALKHLFEAGANLELEQKVDAGSLGLSTGLPVTALDRVFDAYRDTTNPELFALMEYLLFRVTPYRSISRLRTYVREKDFEAGALGDLCKWIVAGSKLPILASIEVAAFFFDTAAIFFVNKDSLEDQGKYFTKLAISLTNDIESDHLAMMALECPDALGRCPMGLAISTRNTEFIGDPRITRIMNTIWARTEFMKEKTFTSVWSFGYLIEKMVAHPRQFSRIPIGKFIIEAWGYIFFLTLFSYFVTTKENITTDITWIESILWITVLAFLTHEVAELKEKGVLDYFRGDNWNWLDLTIYSLFIVMLLTRLSNPEVLTFYSMIVSINTVLMWVRFSYIFVMHPKLGPMIRTVFQIRYDILHFIVLLFVGLTGFGFAFSFLMNFRDREAYVNCVAVGLADGGNDNCEISAFKNWRESIFFLYQAMLGQWSFDVFDFLINEPTRLFGRILFAIFLAIFIVVMLNLLIAMMADTYQSVSERQTLEYNFGRSNLIWKLDSGNNSLPPPGNLLVYMLFLVWSGVATLLEISRRTRNAIPGQEPAAIELDDGKTPKKSADEWICGYCHKRNEPKTHAATREMIDKLMTSLSVDPKKVSAAGASGSDEKQGYDKSDLDKLYEGMVICGNCYRAKKEIGPFQLVREKISSILFLLFFAFPLFLAFCVPFGTVILLNKIIDLLEIKKKRREEQQLKMDAANKAEFHAITKVQQTRTRWVQKHLSDDAKSVDDVYQKLVEISDRLPEKEVKEEEKDEEERKKKKFDEMQSSIVDRITEYSAIDQKLLDKWDRIMAERFPTGAGPPGIVRITSTLDPHTPLRTGDAAVAVIDTGSPTSASAPDSPTSLPAATSDPADLSSPTASPDPSDPSDP